MVSDGKKNIAEPCPPDPLWLVDVRSSYVFESDFERGRDASGDAWNGRFGASRRFAFDGPNWSGLECAQWYLRFGLEYSRFEFDNAGSLPLPDHLQSLSARIGVEYLVQGIPAFLIEAFPGFYFEDDMRSDRFDVPVRVAAGFRITDALFGAVGVSYTSFRSVPFIPLVGAYWRINEQWALSLLAPSPRLVYTPSSAWEFWVGGELAGGSFRVDSGDKGRQEKLRGAVLSYSEYRVGAGVAWKNDVWTVEFGGGYALQRKFDFHRAEEGYKTDEGAPYVAVEVRARF